MTGKRCTCGEQTLCLCPVHRPDEIPVIKDIAGQPPMSNAAEEMQRAALTFSNAVEHMGRLVDRMEAAAQAMTEAIEKGRL